MSSQPTTYLSPAEYLERDRRAEYKSEYFNGEMFAMAGASPNHVWIVANLMVNLGQQLLPKPCRISASDLRLRVTPTGLYTYPDVMVVCGDPQFAEDEKDTLLNPTLIIEVLSDSTRDYDRSQKFEHYRRLSSLGEYLTVAQNAPHVEHWTRQPEERWLLAEYRDLGQTIRLASIDCVLSLANIYNKVEFTPSTAPPPPGSGAENPG
jgi:Uma2 family endonuclease